MADFGSSEAGKKGGRARAEKLTKEDRKEIARRAAEARWEKSGKPPVPTATHVGVLEIGDLSVECAVLENGNRVLSQRGFMGALGIKHGGSMSAVRVDKSDGAVYPLFLAQKNLRPFIDKDLVSVLVDPIKYRTPDRGAMAHGINATLIPRVCNVWLQARDAGVLKGNRQLLAAEKADILIRGLAEVGITALVDEATGYQRDREKDALAKILEAFVAKELKKWVRTFDASYYEELCRLRGVEYPPTKKNFPRYFGRLTNNLVYDRLAPGVRTELERKNPSNESGNRPSRHHQWLTRDVGHPKLLQHLGKVIGLMQVSDDWKAFMTLINRAAPPYPKYPTIFDTLEDDEQSI